MGFPKPGTGFSIGGTGFSIGGIGFSIGGIGFSIGGIGNSKPATDFSKGGTGARRGGAVNAARGGRKKKWQPRVSRRTVASQNLYRDEKTFKVYEAWGLRLSSEDLGLFLLNCVAKVQCFVLINKE